MGQIVQYGKMNPYQRDRTLKWVDLKDPGKQGSGETPKHTHENEVNKNAPHVKTLPLAKLIPIQDTLDFS